MTSFSFESDAALGSRCMDVLLRNVGLLETERFVAYLSREAADYTQWRQTQFEDMSLEELGAMTRASGEHVRRVLATEKALNNIS